MRRDKRDPFLGPEFGATALPVLAASGLVALLGSLPPAALLLAWIGGALGIALPVAALRREAAAADASERRR